MLDHVSIPVVDLDRAAGFYDAVLSTLRLYRRKERPGAIGYGPETRPASVCWILARESEGGRAIASSFRRGPVMQTSPFTILGIVCLGMGLSFLLADWRTPTSRALALLFGTMGANMFLNSVVPLKGNPSLEEIAFWARLFAVAEALSFVTGYEWLLRIRRTEAAPGGSLRTREGLLRAAQAIAIFHGAFGFLFPEERYLLHLAFEREPAVQFFSRASVWYSALPIYFSLGLALVSIVQLIRSRPDSAEVVRLIAIAIAIPFLISGMFLPLWRLWSRRLRPGSR